MFFLSTYSRREPLQVSGTDFLWPIYGTKPSLSKHQRELEILAPFFLVHHWTLERLLYSLLWDPVSVEMATPSVVRVMHKPCFFVKTEQHWRVPVCCSACRLCAVFPVANEKEVTLCVVRCLHGESGFTAWERISSCTASALQPANLSEH